MKTSIKALTNKEKTKLYSILEKVSDKTGVVVEVITSKARISREAAIARHVYFYTARRFCDSTMSLSKIGSIVHRDHSNVVYGIKNIYKDIDTEYKPTLKVLKELGLTVAVYHEYILTWEMPNLISVLKYNTELTLNVVLESTK